MTRRHAAEKREILPDAKFGDLVLSKFMIAFLTNASNSPFDRSVALEYLKLVVNNILTNSGDTIQVIVSLIITLNDSRSGM